MKNANPVLQATPRIARSHRLPQSAALAVALAMAVVGTPGCAKEKAAAPAAAAKPFSDYFPIRVGDKTVRMQLAVRSGEMQHGLMERRDLGRDDGMIFVYEKPQQMGFWMRNTPTPLDIGFFNREGVLEEVYAMYPFDERTVGSRGRAMQFALEMNQGWYRENGIKPGAKLDLKALAEAMKARGFELRRFGLAP